MEDSKFREVLPDARSVLSILLEWQLELANLVLSPQQSCFFDVKAALESSTKLKFYFTTALAFFERPGFISFADKYLSEHAYDRMFAMFSTYDQGKQLEAIDLAIQWIQAGLRRCAPAEEILQNEPPTTATKEPRFKPPNCKSCGSSTKVTSTKDSFRNLKCTKCEATDQVKK